MKKIALMTAVLTASLLATSIKIPMDPKLLSQDKGGLLPAIQAYQDGVGIVVIGDLEGDAVNNKPLNELVYKYGHEAKDSGKSVSDYVIDNSGLMPVEDVKKAQEIKDGPVEPVIPLEGSNCNDNNPLTVNDKYDSNGICEGNHIPTYSFSNTSIIVEYGYSGDISYSLSDNDGDSVTITKATNDSEIVISNGKITYTPTSDNDSSKTVKFIISDGVTDIERSLTFVSTKMVVPEGTIFTKRVVGVTFRPTSTSHNSGYPVTVYDMSDNVIAQKNAFANNELHGSELNITFSPSFIKKIHFKGNTPSYNPSGGGIYLSKIYFEDNTVLLFNNTCISYSHNYCTDTRRFWSTVLISGKTSGYGPSPYIGFDYTQSDTPDINTNPGKYHAKIFPISQDRRITYRENF